MKSLNPVSLKINLKERKKESKKIKRKKHLSFCHLIIFSFLQMKKHLNYIILLILVHKCLKEYLRKMKFHFYFHMDFTAPYFLHNSFTHKQQFTNFRPSSYCILVILIFDVGVNKLYYVWTISYLSKGCNLIDLFC